MTTDAITRPVTREANDFRLLLDRLHRAPLDESGREFVRQALDEGAVLDQVDADSLLELALVARQHGLIGQACTVYNRLHDRFPDYLKGWQEHCDLLMLLDDRPALVRVRARAEQAMGPEVAATLPGPAEGTGSISEGTGEGDVAAPFIELRREEEQVQLFLRIFRGREDAFARQWVDRREEKQGYVPVRHPMEAADVRDHLAGHRTYGIYLLDRESRVHVGVIDVDLIARLRDVREAKKERAAIRRESLYLHRQIDTLAREAGLACLAEISGGKGYHFWFPVAEPVPAAVMRAALQRLVGKLDQDLECFSLEIFPKQDKRTGKGFGNLVKLPLGIHRGTGKPSSFVMAADRSRESQFELLAKLKPAPAENFQRLAGEHNSAVITVHPRHEAWAGEYPELAVLESRCGMLGRIMATLRSARTLSLREEKILLGTIGHLPRAGLLLHHLFSGLPEYSRPLLDYKISRVRGTVLGCKRIHSLLEHGGDLPCRFEGGGYAHPLRHLPDFEEETLPRSERVENLQDALTGLKKAIRQVERFL
jgi:hypothetical protein